MYLIAVYWLSVQIKLLVYPEAAGGISMRIHYYKVEVT